MPAPSALTPAQAQQSRGDGTGAILVMRVPREEFAQLNQNDFWVKFLGFLKLDFPTVRFINVLTADPLALSAVRAAAPDATRLLLFGSQLVAPLPKEAPAYQPYPLENGLTLLRAHAAADLNTERKKLLLAAVLPWVAA